MIKTQLPLLLGKDNYIKECQSSSYNIAMCSRNKDLSIQERYDMFYNNYNKFFDDGFITRYSFIYMECQEAKNKCNTKENIKEFYNSRIQKSKKLCIENYEPNCVAREINPKILIPTSYISNYSQEEKIKLFEKSILKNYMSSDEICVPLLKFYRILSKKEKEHLNPIVIKECDKLKSLGTG